MTRSTYCTAMSNTAAHLLSTSLSRRPLAPAPHRLRPVRRSRHQATAQPRLRAPPAAGRRQPAEGQRQGVASRLGAINYCSVWKASCFSSTCHARSPQANFIRGLGMRTCLQTTRLVGWEEDSMLRSRNRWCAARTLTTKRPMMSSSCRSSTMLQRRVIRMNSSKLPAASSSHVPVSESSDGVPRKAASRCVLCVECWAALLTEADQAESSPSSASSTSRPCAAMPCKQTQMWLRAV